MRAALVVGLVLLGLALGARLAREIDGARRRAESPTETLPIVAVGRGALLPPPLWGHGPDTLPDALLIGDRNLTLAANPVGLRAAAVDASWDLVSFANHDVARDGRAAAELIELAGLPVGTTLVLANRGSVAPADEDTAGALAAWLRRLGAESSPFEREPASWAYVGLRRPAGWVKLAEARASDVGVAVAFGLARDPTRYDGFEGDMAVATLERRAEVRLELEVASAAFVEGVRHVPRAVVGHFGLESLLAVPFVADGEPRDARIVWERVRLGSAPSFRVNAGLVDGSWERSNGVGLSLWIDDELVRDERLDRDPRPPTTWGLWEVDLERYANRSVKLELRVAPAGDATDDHAAWGRPTLRFGPSGG